jgi:YHS domain-containing protein
MITIIAMSAVLLGQAQTLKCPVMGGAVAQNTTFVEYQGAQFGFCCPGCEGNFAKSPDKFIETQRKAGNTVGSFLFDPVTRKRIDPPKAAATKDYNGIRYYFTSVDSATAFGKSPSKFSLAPKKEALYCPVGKEVVASYAKASDYVDFEGVRWYMCCEGCGDPFEKSPRQYLTPAALEHVKAPAVLKRGESTPEAPTADTITKVKFGKFEAELRVPDEGLFASEEVDVEFRVVDTTSKDPIEEGFKGVGGISATAVMTMPSMQGMPEAKPNVHREGVPGDYGIELYFPHGGDYKIDLTLDIPGEGKKSISFIVDVKDERPANSSKPQPYRLDVVDWPVHAMAGLPTKLRMRVTDVKAGTTQRDFDVAHEKLFHLLIASRDLNWFIHEHPEMAEDGTWEIPITFPAGGDYWVYGDVAPSGKGSRVLIAKVSVHGDKPTWNTKLTLTRTARDGGLRGELSTLSPIEVGKKAIVEVKLFDDNSGTPATDTVKWLGAAGHMMIFHQDGQTVVHSHPAEDEVSESLAKQGVMRFTGRFPKAGLYKVYAQFDWRGSVRTVGFAIEVK